MELCDRVLARFVETLLDLDTADALRAAVARGRSGGAHTVRGDTRRSRKSAS